MYRLREILTKHTADKDLAPRTQKNHCNSVTQGLTNQRGTKAKRTGQRWSSVPRVNGDVNLKGTESLPSSFLSPSFCSCFPVTRDQISCTWTPHHYYPALPVLNDLLSCGLECLKAMTQRKPFLSWLSGNLLEQ